MSDHDVGVSIPINTRKVAYRSRSCNSSAIPRVAFSFSAAGSFHFHLLAEQDATSTTIRAAQALQRCISIIGSAKTDASAGRSEALAATCQAL